MHLLSAQPGAVLDGAEPVDLAQEPGDIVLLSAADTEINALAHAKAELGRQIPSLRLANLSHLSHNYSVDLYLEKTLSGAKLIILRLMGGPSYWRYGLDELTALARGRGIMLAVMPGDHRPDPALEGASTLPETDVNRLWAYMVEGGPANMNRLLRYCAYLLHGGEKPKPAAPLPQALLYWPGQNSPDLELVRQRWSPGAPIAPLIFYRALLQAADTAPIDALANALLEKGINPLPIAVTSLKDQAASAIIWQYFKAAPPSVIINCTGFAVSSPGADWRGAVLDKPGVPVLQAILAGINETDWRENQRGLGARDIAMSVSLPEIDGRILSRAISFKSERRFDAASQTGLIIHSPRADRITYVAELAANWARLAQTPAKARNIAIILSNYPSSDGRIANGVGLDTPAGTIRLLNAMQAAGYTAGNLPENGAELMRQLQSGPTNAPLGGKTISHILPLSEYLAVFTALPPRIQDEINTRWGAPQDDHFFLSKDQGFAIGALHSGNITIAVQPARGYDMDAKTIHHDPELAPPHGYLAFYIWIRKIFHAHAVLHMGKHGNLEWLPGKALALSGECYPEILLGPLPHIYPFIANDPGEGTQAKRRTSAVIVSHLTPPLTRADTYGPLKDLEALVDEYYEASGVDPRRLKLLGARILDKTRDLGLDKDCGIKSGASENEQLQQLDNYLCELKELQIRDGLHVFGQNPQGEQLDNLTLALLRIPRKQGKGEDASLVRALSHDLQLERFDPLDCEYAEPWDGPRPAALANIPATSWRINGDTVERLEALALDLVSGAKTAPESWTQTNAVLTGLENTVRPRLAACGKAEIKGALRALDGKFLAPGPSGAPTRGRLDVLPTGKNFYSVDTRSVPTKTAWDLGRLSADRLITAYFQEHGEWPRRMGLSAWGTSNMRTGGDDIAQALALIGARPQWDPASRRVTGFKIIPLSELKRPRIDILFRISGFFRDAFPAQIDLLDSACRAVAALDEPAGANPLAKSDAPRIFGAKPGRFGAGLQDRIETGAWSTRDDLAKAYIDQGAHAYGAGLEGKAAKTQFKALLKSLDAVVHNQDAREFDLLDSDDFYDFEGGMAAAAEHVSGKTPMIYHNDHSNPQNPKIRTLENEISLIVRGRAANPKWIRGQMRHGYKGAADMAQTLSNLFAFAATTGAVANHHFEMLFEAYLIDPQTLAFLEDANPAALRDMAAKFLEASSRDLWRPRRNSALDYLSELTKQETPQ